MNFHWMTEPVVWYGALMVGHATVLALLTAVVSRTVLRRCRPAVHAVLWLIVLIKFACPPVFPGDMTLSGWLVSAWPTVMTGAGSEGDARMDLGGSVAASDAVRSASSVASASWLGSWGWRETALALYVLGLCAALFRWLLARRRLQSHLARTQPAPVRVVDHVASLCRRIGLLASVPVRLTAERTGPWVSGFWRPVLVLPVEMFRSVEGVTRDAMIIHELAHIRRGDLLVRALENLLRVVLYFWPPVWWVCRRIERYSEMACDQWALLASRIAPDVYADTLLSMARCRTDRESGLATAVALVSNGRTLEERITMILNTRSTAPRYRWQIAAVMMAWCLFALAGGATGTPQTPPDDKPAPRTDQPRPGGPPSGDLDQPVMPERAKQLLEQYGEEGIDANADGTLTRREVMDFFKKKGLPMPGRPGGPGQGRPGQGPGGPPGEGRFGGGRPGEGPGELLTLFEHFLRIETGNVDREHVIDIYPAADTDKDGKLSDAELAKALEFAHDAAVHRILQAAPDTDKDGKLSDAELTTFKETTLARIGQRVLQANPKADSDGDGKLSAAEFLAYRDEQRAKQRQMMLERHPEADTDKDGKLSEAEMRAFEQKMREQAPHGRDGADDGPHRPLPGERNDQGDKPHGAPTGGGAGAGPVRP